jgi:hypothetical protein
VQDWKREFLRFTNKLGSLKTGWLVLEIFKKASFSDHFSVSGQGVCGEAPARISDRYSLLG